MSYVEINWSKEDMIASILSQYFSISESLELWRFLSSLTFFSSRIFYFEVLRRHVRKYIVMNEKYVKSQVLFSCAVNLREADIVKFPSKNLMWRFHFN